MWKVILNISLLYYVCATDIIVNLPKGKIRGFIGQTVRHNVTYYAFSGIPFAKPPLGHLRFQAPQPAESWTGILDARSYTRQCYQCTKDSRYETEDCLHIHVVTPQKPGSRADLPVLVYIYGGSFLYGSSGGTKGQQYLVESGLVVVTFNYRVGPFGMLSTNDGVIPGNAGLKDQRLALKWVQENIHFFGGDPKKVTIMGQSAGAASVSYQVLSHTTSGLFRGAIGCSASALCPWAHQANALQTAIGIANMIDPKFGHNKTTKELNNFLTSVPAHDIDQTASKYYIFAPVVEVEGPDAIITKPMYETTLSGQFNRVPMLFGINSEEEISKAGNLPVFKYRAMRWDKDLAGICEGGMNVANNQTRLVVGEKIRQLYTKGKFQDDLAAAIKYMSDFMFTRGTTRFAELASKYADVHFYKFSYHGELGGNHNSIEGADKVAHGEEGKYLWLYHDKLDTFPKSDITTLERFVGIIANFVKTLKPIPPNSELYHNINWPTIGGASLRYLDIDTALTVKEVPRSPQYKGWVHLWETYGKRPFVTF